MSLREVREALAEQIKAGLARETEVYAYDDDSDQYPRIVINTRDDYIDYYATLGRSGGADVKLAVTLYVAGSDGSPQIALDDYLSVGTGNQSSVIDALLDDKTLGGTVDDCVVLTATGHRRLVDGWTASIPVDIYLTKEWP